MNRRHEASLGAIGLAGSVLVTVGSWWVGALPSAFADNPPQLITLFPIGSTVPRGLYYVGLATMILVWLAVGRAIRRGDPLPIARWTVLWALPLLFAMPMGRDLWAYAAQGNLLQHGLDPYQYGPGVLPGLYSNEVSPIWLYSTSPYGPFWLFISRIATQAAGAHIVVAALLLRLPAFAGLLAWIWTIPRLAARLGPATAARADFALWLAAASPVTLVLGLGGGHNDLAMIALMLVGLLIATTGGPWSRLLVAGLVFGLAVSIKSPAAVALAFSVPLWLRATDQRPRLRTVLIASATVLLGAAATLALSSVATGLGLGWTNQAATGVAVVSWLSAPTALSMLVALATGGAHGSTTLDSSMRAFRLAGEIVAVVWVAACWLFAFRGRVIAWLAAALGVAAVLTPAVQPWYLLWALALAGLAGRGRFIVLAGTMAGVLFPVLYRPNGQGLDMKPIGAALVAGAALITWLSTRERLSTRDATRPGSILPEVIPADDNSAEHARAEVSADDGAEL
jgi:alpha-1,6-mannosyltransferase